MRAGTITLQWTITVTQLEFKVNRADVDAKLQPLMARLSEPEQLMAGIAVELLSLTEKAFESEGYPESWQGLAESTIAQRTKKGQWPGKILQVSAAGLAASVQPFHSSDEAGLTVSKPYAAIQQFGGAAGRNHASIIPARSYLPIESGDGMELTEEATESILLLAREFVFGD